MKLFSFQSRNVTYKACIWINIFKRVEIQEQQHRLGLQAELEAAECAAADLRQMLSMFFGDSPASSPDTASDAGRHKASSLDHEMSWKLASSSSPSHLHSGLPGTLDRRDSRLQMDLAGIQKRLHKIAQLRDTPPSSPRSAERISAWSSPSKSDAASPSADLNRSRTLGSRMSPLKLSPLRTTTMSPSVQHDESSSHVHARFAESEADSPESGSGSAEYEPSCHVDQSSSQDTAHGFTDQTVPLPDRSHDAVSLASSRTCQPDPE